MMNARLLLLVSLFFTICAPRAAAQPAPCSGISPSAYEDSESGLKQLLVDIVQALKAKAEQEAEALAESLALKRPDACFVSLFGPEEGALVSAMYLKVREFRREKIPNGLRTAARNKNSIIGVEHVQVRPESHGRALEAATTRAMVKPVSLYSASYTRDDSKSLFALGYFVFADGRFFSVGSVVLSALSTAPPMRIRVGGNVQRSRMIASPPPVYPESAKEAGIKGTVRLQVVIGTDGKVKELEVVSGPRELIQPTLDAVRQWQYQPAYLNGLAVEVSTTIDVIYTLSRQGRGNFSASNGITAM